ncbi:MAG: hypothetical protein ABIL77_00475 [candidate division WOR-3 bacterium]
MQKVLVPFLALLVLFAGCNLKVEEWNENKVLPLTFALPLDTDTFTVQEFVEKNNRYLSTMGDTIFYGEDTTIVNTFFAIDSTVIASFGHGLPEDVLDTLRTVLGSEICEIRGRMRFKGMVYSDLRMVFFISYYRSGTEVRRDSSIFMFPMGYRDTTVYLTLRNVPIGSFSVNLRGIGSLGAAQIDTMELSYTMPINVNLRGDTLVLKEIVLEIDSSIIEWANKEVLDTIEFGINVWNRIPMGYILNVWALDKEKDDSVAVIMANVPQPLISNGFAQSEKHGFFKVILERSFGELLKKDTMYLHVIATVPPYGESVKLRPQDYLRYNMYLKIRGYLDFQKLREE